MFAGLRAESVNHFDFNVLLGVALNVLHESFFVHTDQVDGSAISSRAAGTANPVHIIFAHIGNFVVHHMRQIINVDSACGNIGGHQGAYVAALEACQRLCARSLALVAVQCHRLNAVFGQEFGDVVGAKFGAGEHQHLAPVLLLNDMNQQGLFLATADRVDHLSDTLHCRVARGDLYALRVL